MLGHEPQLETRQLFGYAMQRKAQDNRMAKDATPLDESLARCFQD